MYDLSHLSRKRVASGGVANVIEFTGMTFLVMLSPTFVPVPTIGPTRSIWGQLLHNANMSW
ncbi:hypothetical protein Mapa_011322 [Marchantia paleacea]|nr:hypothetical protein Mapa_011322 [Marchantia paleacea]